MLTTGEVAKLFHVSAQTVINWLDQGRMPFERIGRGPRRLTEESVLRYVDEIGISPEALDEEIYARATKAVAAGNHGHKGPAVMVIDTELKFLAWSDGARSLFGFTNVEMLGKPLAKLGSAVSGNHGSLEEVVRSPWQDKCLQLQATQLTRQGKMINTVLTVSRFYLDGVALGYIIAAKERREEKASEDSLEPFNRRNEDRRAA